MILLFVFQSDKKWIFTYLLLFVQLWLSPLRYYWSHFWFNDKSILIYNVLSVYLHNLQFQYDFYLILYNICVWKWNRKNKDFLF